MKRYNYLLLFLLTSVLLSACDGFLKETSQDEFEPETTASFAELLQGDGYNYFATLDGITPHLSDDVMSVSYAYHQEVNTAYVNVFAWQSYMFEALDDANFYPSMYERHYSRIMICNMITEEAPKSIGTQEEKDQLVGEALALRAFYYFQLVNFFGKPYNAPGTTPEQSPGVPLSLKSEILDEGIARHSVKDVYDQIVKDIEEAIALLEKEKKTYSTYRISHTAARLLASRVYLYMENWDKVIEHATAALKSAPGLCYLPDYTLSNYMTPNNGVSSRNFPETIFLFTGQFRLFSSDFSRPYSLSTDLTATFDPSDSRIGKYYYDNVYINIPFCNKVGSSEMSYVWRTAELYLNRAEAYAMKYKAGDVASGTLSVNDLNALRSNRFVGYTDYSPGTAEELVTFCREERRRELFFEGHRWFDLRRYGMPRLEHVWWDANGVGTRYVLEQNDPAYTLPIPQKVLDRNSKLIQNELAPARSGSSV